MRGHDAPTGRFDPSGGLRGRREGREGQVVTVGPAPAPPPVWAPLGPGPEDTDVAEGLGLSDVAADRPHGDVGLGAELLLTPPDRLAGLVAAGSEQQQQRFRPTGEHRIDRYPVEPIPPLWPRTSSWLATVIVRHGDGPVSCHFGAKAGPSRVAIHKWWIENACSYSHREISTRCPPEQIGQQLGQVVTVAVFGLAVSAAAEELRSGSRGLGDGHVAPPAVDHVGR